MEPCLLRLTIPDTVDLLELMGPADAYLRSIEASWDVFIVVRGTMISVKGPRVDVAQVIEVFSELIDQIGAGIAPTKNSVELLIDAVKHANCTSAAANPDASAAHSAAHSMTANSASIAGLNQATSSTNLPTRESTSKTGAPKKTPDVILHVHGRAIYPKTEGQTRYVEAIRNNLITFGTGPAGTGKTYLAMAMAVSALQKREVSRIILTRPVVEAGESLGFLPGTLEEKLDPYIRPLYDALCDIQDMEKLPLLMEQHIIQIVPLAFMRGRTFNDAFVILDEAQNTTPQQMKMFLTRLGFGSRFIITGDMSQRDVLGENGLVSARTILKDIDDIAFIELNAKDIVRHRLVARIVDAYAAAEAHSQVSACRRVQTRPQTEAHTHTSIHAQTAAQGEE